ncbi:MAG: hypothetical protein QY326_01170 [Bdellovibrionota bacterium]|nr:MAG: hypothetical protein QY326_01170 [Bdellovibrionota bacterium]
MAEFTKYQSVAAAIASIGLATFPERSADYGPTFDTAPAVAPSSPTISADSHAVEGSPNIDPRLFDIGLDSVRARALELAHVFPESQRLFDGVTGNIGDRVAIQPLEPGTFGTYQADTEQISLSAGEIERTYAQAKERGFSDNEANELAAIAITPTLVHELWHARYPAAEYTDRTIDEEVICRIRDTEAEHLLSMAAMYAYPEYQGHVNFVLLDSTADRASTLRTGGEIIRAELKQPETKYTLLADLQDVMANLPPRETVSNTTTWDYFHSSGRFLADVRQEALADLQRITAEERHAVLVCAADLLNRRETLGQEEKLAQANCLVSGAVLHDPALLTTGPFVELLAYVRQCETSSPQSGAATLALAELAKSDPASAESGAFFGFHKLWSSSPDQLGRALKRASQSDLYLPPSSNAATTLMRYVNDMHRWHLIESPLLSDAECLSFLECYSTIGTMAPATIPDGRAAVMSLGAQWLGREAAGRVPEPWNVRLYLDTATHYGVQDQACSILDSTFDATVVSIQLGGISPRNVEPFSLGALAEMSGRPIDTLRPVAEQMISAMRHDVRTPDGFEVSAMTAWRDLLPQLTPEVNALLEMRVEYLEDKIANTQLMRDTILLRYELAEIQGALKQK